MIGLGERGHGLSDAQRRTAWILGAVLGVAIGTVVVTAIIVIA